MPALDTASSSRVVLFTFDCAVVFCHLTVGVKCIFCGVQLPWQSYRIIANHLVLVFCSDLMSNLSKKQLVSIGTIISRINDKNDNNIAKYL